MSDYIKPVVFKVGNEMYGVDINLVQSIEREIQVVPVPNSMPVKALSPQLEYDNPDIPG